MFKYTLRITGPDAPGFIYKVTKVLFDLQCNVISQDEYVSPDGFFMMRTVFSSNQEIKDELVLVNLKNIISNPSVQIEMIQSKAKNLILFCTKEHHCLSEILTKHYFGELKANIVAVISNHEVLQEYTEKFNIPFHFISADGTDREQHEAQVFKIADSYSFDYMVLAKYMRILTPGFVSKYADKIINIHHSFLPAFIGANPYKQAFDRGVKIIGATAHFVNDHLDEGPIIAQDIKEVDHRYSATDMAKEGRDVEKMVLLKALKLVLDDRVFVHSNKTIIL
jgi:formyltetrahydrofolate deformylase